MKKTNRLLEDNIKEIINNSVKKALRENIGSDNSNVKSNLYSMMSNLNAVLEMLHNNDYGQENEATVSNLCLLIQRSIEIITKLVINVEKKNIIR